MQIEKINVQDITPGDFIFIENKIFLVVDVTYEIIQNLYHFTCANINSFYLVNFFQFNNNSKLDKIVNNTKEYLEELNSKLNNFEILIWKMRTLIQKEESKNVINNLFI